MIYVPQAEPIYMEVMIARTLIYKWLMWIIRLVKYIITLYICPKYLPERTKMLQDWADYLDEL